MSVLCKMVDGSCVRDMLGRLIYTDDCYEKDGKYYPVGLFALGCSYREISLERSPKRTNYERYFADLGSKDEVSGACSDICDSVSYADCKIGNCVFRYWCDECFSFDIWLEMEAEI